MSDALYMNDVGEGIGFLLELGLMEASHELDDGRWIYSLTDGGYRAVYMLNLVLSSGLSLDEVESVSSDDPATAQVRQTARALVTAMDELGA